MGGPRTRTRRRPQELEGSSDVVESEFRGLWTRTALVPFFLWSASGYRFRRYASVTDSSCTLLAVMWATMITKVVSALIITCLIPIGRCISSNRTPEIEIVRHVVCTQYTPT